MLESNARSPLATREEFEQNFIAHGAELESDWKSRHPRAPLTLTGFVDAMNASGPWAPTPLMCAMVGASGPVEECFFREVVEEHVERLRAALPLEGVFLSLHGGAIGAAEDDPEGVILERLRAVVGPTVPILATLDLHANVSRKMVENANVLVAYRTNPHVDMAERGAECAALMREMLAGVKSTAAFVKLPFIPPSVAQNTKSGPYADIIAYGQSKMNARVMNVSVVSGFSLGDSVKNGMSVIVTTRGDSALAQALARDIAQKAWDDRKRYVPRLTTLEDATRMALRCGRDPSRPALLFADVADNPGGGGRGNTVWILESKDQGATWSRPANITKTIKRDWSWYATGPGVGVQIKQGPHAGRLVIPCDHDYREIPGGKSVRASHAIFSDDHGASWQDAGLPGKTNSTPWCVASHAADPSIVFTATNLGQLFRSLDGGETWTKLEREFGEVRSMLLTPA